jgi:hypothetical protein
MIVYQADKRLFIRSKLQGVKCAPGEFCLRMRAFTGNSEPASLQKKTLWAPLCYTIAKLLPLQRVSDEVHQRGVAVPYCC